MVTRLQDFAQLFCSSRFGDKDGLFEVSLCTPQYKSWCSQPVYVKDVVFNGDCYIDFTALLQEMKERNQVIRVSRHSSSQPYLPRTWVLDEGLLRSVAEEKGWV